MFEIGTQLPLFIFPAEHADEIYRMWNTADLENRRDIEQVLEIKLKECTGVFIDNVLRNGVVAPVCVQFFGASPYPMMGNGHHRLAVAIDYDLPVPVIFDERNYMLEDITDSWDHPRHDNHCVPMPYADDEAFDAEYAHG
jgi:hypothetical protein